MKPQIESLYIQAIYNDEAPSSFADKIIDLFGADEKNLSRSDKISRARWKYLSMVAKILNNEGHTYTPNGTDWQIKWNKDLLYEIYWQSARVEMYPSKKRQLNNKEFCDLVERVMLLFSHIFNINISFPNIMDIIKPEEPNN